jgi:putative heme-binding domain-containing protein
MRHRIILISLFAAAASAAPPPPQNAAEAGRALFLEHCAYCHGARGEGGRGADLTTGQFRHGGSDDALFASIRNGIPGTEMPAVRITDDDVRKLVVFVKGLGAVGPVEKAPGDAAAGRKLYESKGCAVCHSIGSGGGSLGPELTDVGRRRSPKRLQESILDPGADPSPRYRAVQLATAAGQPVVGIRLNEDDVSIQLRDRDGNLRSFLKENLREPPRPAPSLMPSYGATLSRKEIEDVVAYLNTLRGDQ